MLFIERLLQHSRVLPLRLLRQVSLVGGSPVEMGEVEEEEPLLPTNPLRPRNLDPVASATRWDTPESPAHSGDVETANLGLHVVEIEFDFLWIRSNFNF